MSVERDPGSAERPSAAGEDESLAHPPDIPGGEAAAESPADVQPATGGQPDERAASRNMLPQRERRRTGAERLLVRLIATCGIVAIGVAIAAIMVSSNSKGWLVGLVVSIVSVVLAAILWSSRQL
jgi:hypothetical protein